MVQRIEQYSAALLKPLLVSPISFKRQFDVVLTALTQLRIRATILAKLPQGDSWLADLKRYSQTIDPMPDVYLMSRRSSPQSDQIGSVAIPSAHAMRGEYFLLAISDTVGLMIRGQREDVVLNSEESTSDIEESSEDTVSLPKVRYSITFQKPLIQKRLDDLYRVLQSSFREWPNQPLLESLIANWEDATSLPEQSHPALIDAVMLRQADYQEQLQQKARAYRRQAMTASSLSTQNEALLNTLRSKDDFLNTVGQELRTPLSTIKTALPLLSSPSLKPPQRQRYLDTISRECDRQVNLIKGVLELLQIERNSTAVRPEPVKLSDVLPGIVSTYQPLAQEKGIRLAYTVPNTLPEVCCPENWVRQVIIHLLSNSIRYTDGGGEVWVIAQDSDDTEYLDIHVRDTGMGIPQNELPRIFDHFYRGRQLNADDEGAGLGLSIVQQLLIYCGGDISVESQPEVGTHFKVRLPLCQAEA